MIRQFELVERVRVYDPTASEDLLNRGYVFAMKAHGSQKRASGDPYFSHPLEVAGILTRYKLDADTIVTALLHDTIEDTEISRDDVEEQFGPNVAPPCRRCNQTDPHRISIRSGQAGGKFSKIRPRHVRRYSGSSRQVG